MMLQQSTSFNPFMRQLITFARIARGTSNHDIIRPIRTTSNQRDDVIYMIFGQFPVAPIAFTLLSIELFFNIIWRVFALCAFSVGVTVTMNGFYKFWMSCTIEATSGKYARSTGGITVETSKPLAVLAYSNQSISTNYVFSKGRSRFVYTAFRTLFEVRYSKCAFLSLSILRLMNKYMALLTICVQTGFDSTAMRKVFQGSKLYFFTFSTAFIPIWNDINRFSFNIVIFLCNIFAYFAHSYDTVTAMLFSGVEKFSGSRFDFFALSALLKRGEIIHVLNCLSFSSLISFCCQGDKANTSSSGVITPSLGNSYIISFFPLAYKAERGGIIS